MHIVLIHYHLKTGGVTSVIEKQVKGLLTSKHEVTVLTGYINSDSPLLTPRCKVIVEPLFNYLDTPRSTEEYLHIHATISDTIKKTVHEDTVIYIHNGNMCKNSILTYIIYRLVKAGTPVVHHCHDFAEDRPKNMAAFFSCSGFFSYKSAQEVFYPREDNCHFVTINSEDRKRLVAVGISEQKVSMIPNPIGVHCSPKPDSKEQLYKTLEISFETKIITYPVRAIKRKNIGEFLLFAALFPQYLWCITQPPNTEDDIIEYKLWKKLSQKLQLPIRFEVGKRVDFEALLTHSYCCITTSIQEGFGLTFLEPWLYGTPVIGRNIEMVTRDFIKNVRFPSLYNSIQTFVNKRIQDFKELSQREKEELITKVVEDTKARESIIYNNPWMYTFLQDVPNALVEQNRKTIEQHYSLQSFTTRCTDMCHALLQQK